MLNIAIRAARGAGAIIARSVDRVDRLSITIKSQNDFVSEIDKRAEQEIIYTLQKAFPDHSILAEESGAQEGNEYEWIIDPLDGTTNFLYGFPHFAVSIALRYKGRLEQAVIYDPLRDELFTASRGVGAQLNNHRIRVSNRTHLDSALLGTGMPFKEMAHLDAYLGMLKSLVPTSTGIRRAGSAALDLAYVAAGRLDGFWEIGLQPWDMAAGVLLIQEAGGLVTDLSGEDQFMKTGNIVGGNSKILKALQSAIKPHLSADLK